MGCENTPHVLVDHIDRDKLNNRRNNLRIVTAQQNAFNQSKRSNNKSGVIGVCWWDRDKNWLAQIKFNYKRHFLGYYDKFEDAIALYHEYGDMIHINDNEYGVSFDYGDWN